MRTYGRVQNPDGSLQWVTVTTDAAGFNDDVWVTTLCQALQLNLNESPFYSQYGIPAQPDVIQQLQPDFYVSRTQQQFAPYFANLVVAKIASNPPAYKINVTKNNGAKVSATLEVPT